MATTMPLYLCRDHGRANAIPKKYKLATSTCGYFRSVVSLQDWGVRRRLCRGRHFLCYFRLFDDGNHRQRTPEAKLLPIGILRI